MPYTTMEICEITKHTGLQNKFTRQAAATEKIHKYTTQTRSDRSDQTDVNKSELTSISTP
jgi:hypothetical protein